MMIKEKTEEWKNMEEEMQGAVVTAWSGIKFSWKYSLILIPGIFLIIAVFVEVLDSLS